jgi:HmuY protein
MKQSNFYHSVLCVVILASLISCSNNDPSPVNLAGVIYKDLNADYALSVSNPVGPPFYPTQTKKYTLFSFKTGAVVANADSSKNTWDVAFQATNIILNINGNVGVKIVQGIFGELKSAPLDGYTMDTYTVSTKTRTVAISRSPKPIDVAVTNQWWYNAGTNVSTIVAPIAGQVFFIKTANGNYAKFEILSYYKGDPASIDNSKDLERYYTFRYVYQPNGTTTF